MWNKIQKIYIGSNQVRPPTWKPWSNTLAYRPINGTTTTTDQSWNNYNLTRSWTITYDSISASTDGSSYFRNEWVSPLASVSQLTISLRYRFTTAWSWDVKTIYFMGSMSNQWRKFHLYREVWGKLVFNGGYYTREYSSISANTRYNITLTWDGTTTTMYLNWSSVSAGTHSYEKNYWKNVFLFRTGSSSSPLPDVSWSKLSNVIIENRAWDSAEVSKYYNLTKWIYWL